MVRRTFFKGGQAYLSNDSSTRFLSPLQLKLEHVKVRSVLKIHKCYILNNFEVHKVKDYTHNK